MALPERGTQRLREHRWSNPGTRYFVTECVRGRKTDLTEPEAANRTMRVFEDLHTCGDADIAAATVMPDHLHVLFTLGSRLSVGQFMAKMKSLARDLGRAPWQWQEDGFERRLRPGDSLAEFGLYIFLNPYRARLIPLTERWPWWFCPRPERFEFLRLLRDGEAVPAGWLEKAMTVKTW